MARNFKELYSKMTPDARARVEVRVDEFKREMELEGIRKSRNLTQVDVARSMGVAQNAISKIESRGDLHVGTLRKYIEAAGGNLRLSAEFPDVMIPINVRGEKRPMTATTRRGATSARHKIETKARPVAKTRKHA